MQNENLLIPDYLFEVSWEVCNKVGGIHTVIATKVASIAKNMKGTHILIGPDIVKSNEANSEFIEDKLLLKSWKAKAISEGLNIRVGKWNIKDEPIVILVDFTTFFEQKDQIFKSLWEQYKLDSIFGQWDYLEPALFGYAAARIIESYVKFHSSPSDNIIAQFHEWMTGAGLLYLKSSLPQVGCVFTTHATVLGRSIAGNSLPLYDGLKNYNPDNMAHNFNVTSKHSLEKISAQNADSFTTVSDITAKECEWFLSKPVDIVTPNGFQDFISDYSDFDEKIKKGRDKLKQVAEAIILNPIDDNALFVGIGGRYEFKNKGLDVFINSLGKLNKNTELNREIVAFILVPAGHHGPLNAVLDNIKNKSKKTKPTSPYLSHDLYDNNDPVLKCIAENNLNNTIDDKVKIFFIPSYLNGDDGVFNIPYYQLLAALDLSVFPSYYEPWGYTPLESIAFKVPTITTSLAGFGLWVKTHYKEERPSITVISRNDDNDKEVEDKIVKHIIRHAKYNSKEFKENKENAFNISHIALWDNLISYYMKAYNNALKKVKERYKESDFIGNTEEKNYVYQSKMFSEPDWFEIIVHRKVPDNLKPLEELAKNLWWSWNQDAIDLFMSIDPLVWAISESNPISLLDKIKYTRYQELNNDKNFLDSLNNVYTKFTKYMNMKNKSKGPKIAYFCMEYGIHSSLKIYSGGLGILAGDYLKEASDKGTNIIGVGLLYRYGYFTQKLSIRGEQEDTYETQHFEKLPIAAQLDSEGEWLKVEMAFPGRKVFARVWKVDIGRVDLFLLDTDFEDNTPEDRSITHHLYGGDWENRLKQEILLGVAGIRVLEKLEIKADVYHCNEGHAAFTGFERIHQLMIKEKLSFDEASEVVRSSSLFTTHTPVPAGHDAFEENIMRKYLAHYPKRFGVSWERIIGLGRIHPGNNDEKFSMSNLAVRLSQEVNGVSWLHGKVSQDMFSNIFPGYLKQETPIGFVTNGVHFETWAAPEWKALFDDIFGEDFKSHNYNKSCFSNIHKVDNRKISGIRNKLRTQLIEYIKLRIISNNDLTYYTPREIVEILEKLDSKKLTFGFARRFATYKRADLLFKNLATLNEIVNHPDHPVQFIFAGKAHPADKAGQDLIKKIVEISKYPQFLGKIIFIENYDMELALKMVQGVDIWLNTPTRPMEASGTSGEKAVMNGVMHFSVLDGWWVEGYKKGVGWALPLVQVYENNDYQNELDAETIYSIIENEIAPLYYEQVNEVSPKWIERIKNSIDQVASNFTSNRMLIDYENKFYNKLTERHTFIKNKNFIKAKEITEWKNRIKKEWENVEVLEIKRPDIYKESVIMGKEYNLEIKIACGNLSHEDIGVEAIALQNIKISDKEINNLFKKEFTFDSINKNIATYKIEFSVGNPGSYSTSIRIFAKNKDLPYQQDFCLVKWL